MLDICFPPETEGWQSTAVKSDVPRSNNSLRHCNVCIYCMMQLCVLCFKSCLQRLFLRVDFSTTDRGCFFFTSNGKKTKNKKQKTQLYILMRTVLPSSHNILYTQAASQRVIKSTLWNWSELTAHWIAIYPCSRICFLYVPPLFTLLLNSHHLKDFSFFFFQFHNQIFLL